MLFLYLPNAPQKGSRLKAWGPGAQDVRKKEALGLAVKSVRLLVAILRNCRRHCPCVSTRVESRVESGVGSEVERGE